MTVVVPEMEASEMEMLVVVPYGWWWWVTTATRGDCDASRHASSKCILLLSIMDLYLGIYCSGPGRWLSR